MVVQEIYNWHLNACFQLLENGRNFHLPFLFFWWCCLYHSFFVFFSFGPKPKRQHLWSTGIALKQRREKCVQRNPTVWTPWMMCFVPSSQKMLAKCFHCLKLVCAHVCWKCVCVGVSQWVKMSVCADLYWFVWVHVFTCVRNGGGWYNWMIMKMLGLE